ncbi:MAG: hypothetical protein RAP03_02580, partial [Candidatus Electryonea clarkiae]|nr:hypothetical protein [Candidatus Electryonea clarkiae]
MGKQLNWMMRWSINSAWKKGRRASESVTHDGKNKILIILPPDERQIKLISSDLFSWLKRKPSKQFFLLHPDAALEIPHEITKHTKSIQYSYEDIKRNGKPQKILRDRIVRESFHLVVLLVPEFHPLTDILFALTPAKLKAAVWGEIRENRANFLAKTRGTSDIIHST